MRELGNRLIGDENSFMFEQRIFNFVMLLSICMAAFGVLLDIYKVDIALLTEPDRSPDSTPSSL